MLMGTDEKQWESVRDILCRRKTEDLRKRVAKALFDHCCTCSGTGRGCVLNKIKALSTDFEMGLSRPFLVEMHKHQQP